MSRTALRRVLVALPLAAGLAVVASPLPASAIGGGDAVITTGTCSGSSDWELKGKHDDGRLEIEAQVDSNRVGQTWSWRLLDNGVRFAAGTATTTAPSGSFTVERRTADRAGVDTIRLRASNARTGETCVGTLRLA